MTNLNNKFKDRDPLETIQIIKNFFNDNNFEIIEEIQEVSEANTYWCSLTLLYNSQQITMSNGKGSESNYALASGYSELYERFCAGFGTYKNDFLYLKKMNELNFLTNNFYLHPNEKFNSFEEIRNSCQKIQEFYSYIKDENNYILKYFNLAFTPSIMSEGSLVVPYKNIDNTKEDKYFNKNLIDLISGSSGLAAGNSLEEALVQGLSECYDHYAHVAIYNKREINYYQLNLNTIQLAPYLKNIINKIEEAGHNLYIFDLSYNFNVPVIMTVLVDKVNHVWFINLGSHPIIDIAIERTLTELYQGNVNIKAKSEKKFNMIPSKNITHSIALRQSPSDIGGNPIYPEEILFNRVIVNDYNKSVFLSNGDYSNQELIDYYKIINQNNNFNVYYFDLSCCEKMSAVQIFIENIELFDKSCYEGLEMKNLEGFLKKNYEIFLNYSLFLEGKKINVTELKSLINEYYMLQDNLDISNFAKLFMGSNCYIFTTTFSIQDFYNHLKDTLNYIYENKLQEEFLIYYYLFLYQDYKLEEIENLFKYLNMPINNTEIKKIYFNKNFLNMDFLFNKLILENYLYNYNNINNFLNAFLK